MRNPLLFLLTIFFLFGCQNKSNVYVELKPHTNLLENSYKNNDSIKEDTLKINLQEKDIEEESLLEEEDDNKNQALMDFYKEWKNVKYKFGGNSKKGIDCSAFIQRIFKEKFHIKIPRSTRTQVKIGKKIKKSQLEIGDLVFFKTGKIDRHVGIYAGEGKFLHASIKGIKFTNLNKPFYKKAYWTSRRIVY